MDALIVAALAAPFGVYELYALRTRKVRTITEVVRQSPRWMRLPLAIALGVGFTHLFFGRP